MRKNDSMIQEFRSEWLKNVVSAQDLPGDATYDVLRDAIAQNDEVWRFSTSPQTWKAKMGRSGFVVLREGKPIAVYIRLMN